MTTQAVLDHQKWLLPTLKDKRWIEVQEETIRLLERQLFHEQLMNAGNELPDAAVLRRATIPLVEYLSKYYNPNVAAIVTMGHIEVLEEKQILFFQQHK